MGKQNKTTKPWLDHRGRELSTEELREISKNWDLQTWKRYGDSLEVQAEGKNLKPGELRRLQAQQTKSIFHIHSEQSADGSVSRRINAALQCLSLKQAEVIQHLFYQGKSIEQAALEMGVCKSTAHIHKRDALAKLKGVLSVRSDAVAVYEGVSDLESEPKTPFEDLLDVMNEDINRDESARRDFDKGEE